MARRNRLPPQTCPRIDRVQQALDEAKQYFAELGKQDDPSNLEQQLTDARDELEAVRDANSELRQAAEDFADDADASEEGYANE